MPRGESASREGRGRRREGEKGEEGWEDGRAEGLKWGVEGEERKRGGGGGGGDLQCDVVCFAVLQQRVVVVAQMPLHLIDGGHTGVCWWVP
jgi:hypothetical protein